VPNPDGGNILRFQKKSYLPEIMGSSKEKTGLNTSRAWRFVMA
jgi:hypothetical protein